MITRRSLLAAPALIPFVAAFPHRAFAGGPGYTYSTLPIWKARLLAAKAGGAQVSICCVGDSTTTGENLGASPLNTRIPNAYPRDLAADLAGAGYAASCENCIGTHNVTPLTAYDFRVVANSMPNNGGSFAGNWFAPTAAATISFQPAAPNATYDRCDVWGIFRGVAGTITIDFAGTGATVVDFSPNLNATSKQTISKTLGSEQVNANWTSASPIFQGFNCYKSTDVVKVINAGWGASQTSSWNNPVSNIFGALACLQGFAPDLTIISLSINDWNLTGGTPGYSRNNLLGIIASAKVSGDVLIIIENPTNNAASYAQQLMWVAMMKDLAASQGCGLVSIWDRWGGSLAAPASALIGADQLHPNALGYTDIAQAILPVILPV